MSDSDLRERFADLWVRLGGHGDVTAAARLGASGAGRSRTAAITGWIISGIAWRASTSPRAVGMERDLAEAALWYHDVVYRPGAPDNEARSAELALAALVEGGASAGDGGRGGAAGAAHRPRRAP